MQLHDLESIQDKRAIDDKNTVQLIYKDMRVERMIEGMRSRKQIAQNLSSAPINKLDVRRGRRDGPADPLKVLADTDTRMAAKHMLKICLSGCVPCSFPTFRSGVHLLPATR